MPRDSEDTAAMVAVEPLALSPQRLAQTGMLSVETEREVQEVQAKFLAAKMFPRDYVAAYNRVVQACKRESLAKVALYAYPRGKGNIVKGPSIRLAEMLASAWGNLSCGVKEIERRDGYSIAKAYCLDLETNTSWESVYTTPHERHTRDGAYALTDPRDIYEAVANNGSRRVRACILRIVPREVVDAAVEEVAKTLRSGGGKTVQERIVDMVSKFIGVGVPQEAIEARLGHAIDVTTEDEIVDLHAIYTTCKDTPKKRFDFFPTMKAPTTATEITEKIKGKKKEDKPVTENEDDWPES